MRPMLDDLELPQVQEITTYHRRVLSEYKPPGMAGSLLQNLGRRPVRLVLWGIAAGDNARDTLEELDAKFRAGNPLPFTADIVDEAEIAEMVIDDVRFQELAGKPERYAYVLTLREYIEPVVPEDSTFLDTEIETDALDLLDDLISSLDITEQLSAFIDRLTTLNETLRHEGINAVIPSR